MWRLMVVDDNERNVELLVEILGDRAQCDVAYNGEDALVAYNRSIEKNAPYDIILLDIVMPGIDGLDVLKAIRAKEEARKIEIGRGVPVIMVTAYKEPFMDAFNKGCDDYILKPVDPDKLVKKIEDKLSKHFSRPESEG
ncbi:MAG: response regulator [Candidatus Omnitrophota bacterium]